MKKPNYSPPDILEAVVLHGGDDLINSVIYRNHTGCNNYNIDPPAMGPQHREDVIEPIVFLER